MKHVSLMILFALAVACGQSGSGGSSEVAKQGLCDLNGNDVACESIQGADGEGIDLLETVIQVPMKIENAEITFLADKSSLTSGRRISCKTSVKNGEVYRFALRGDKLLLMTGSGSFEMERLSDGEGVNGAWMWKGYIEQGTHIIRSVTFMGGNTAILRTTCEL